MNLKKQFMHELNPLLKEAERAIARDDKIEAYALSMEMLELVASYDGKLSRKDIREVLNNPTAAAIAKRLGVQP
jgi:predicted transcriptional regulator